MRFKKYLPIVISLVAAGAAGVAAVLNRKRIQAKVQKSLTTGRDRSARALKVVNKSAKNIRHKIERFIGDGNVKL